MDTKFKKIYSENEHFFDEINTEAKAYVLGFFFADGCNQNRDYSSGQNAISFTQLEQDKDILDKIKEVMECNRPYYETIQKTNEKKKLTLYIVSDIVS